MKLKLLIAGALLFLCVTVFALPGTSYYHTVVINNNTDDAMSFHLWNPDSEGKSHIHYFGIDGWDTFTKGSGKIIYDDKEYDNMPTDGHGEFTIKLDRNSSCHFRCRVFIVTNYLGNDPTPGNLDLAPNDGHGSVYYTCGSYRHLVTTRVFPMSPGTGVVTDVCDLETSHEDRDKDGNVLSTMMDYYGDITFNYDLPPGTLHDSVLIREGETCEISGSTLSLSSETDLKLNQTTFNVPVGKIFTINNKGSLAIENTEARNIKIINNGTVNINGTKFLNDCQKNSIIENYGTLIIDDSVFTNCKGLFSKGGIIHNCNGASTTIGESSEYGVEFNNCKADDTSTSVKTDKCYGGAIYNDKGGYLYLTGSIRFDNCSAHDSGGAIYNNNATIKTDDKTSLTFSGCSATYGSGGAIYIEETDLSITGIGVSFENCNANIDGGAIYTAGSNFNIQTPVTFNTNQASENGGAINVKYGTFSIVNSDDSVRSQFKNNKCGTGKLGTAINLESIEQIYIGDTDFINQGTCKEAIAGASSYGSDVLSDCSFKESK